MSKRKRRPARRTATRRTIDPQPQAQPEQHEQPGTHAEPVEPSPFRGATDQATDALIRLISAQWLPLDRAPSELDRLRAVVIVQDMLDERMSNQARAAHSEGASWQQIGAALGISKQAAFQRYRDRDQP